MTDTTRLPAAPEEIDPAWLTTALRAAGALRRGRVAAVDWEAIGEERGFTGVVVRLRPRYADDEPSENPPPTLVAKLPTAARRAPSAYPAAHRVDAAAGRRHDERCAREVCFYRELAPVVETPVPRAFFAAADAVTGRVLLLLEDLAAARPGDVLRGCSPDEAARVLDAVAPLHARWWGRRDPDPFPWLPRWGSDPAARQERYAGQVGPFLERFGGRLPAAIRELVERLRTRYAAVLTALDMAPAAVIHADLHLDNVAFNPQGAGSPAVVLDWQGVARGAAAVDVAGFVFGSLAPDERRAAEEELLRRYHTRLVEQGVGGYPLARLREDSGLALLALLARTVGWLVGADPDRLVGRERELTEAVIGDGRLVAALLDHGTRRLDGLR